VRRCRNNGKVKLGSRPNFRTDVPPRSNPGINHRKTTICFIFQYDMAERVSVNPIDVQAVLRSSTWEPTVLATSNWPIPCARRAPSLCAIFRRPRRSRRKKVKGLIAANDFLGLRSEEQGRRHRTAILAVGLRRSARSRMPCVEGHAVLPFCSSKLAHS
jgi:hypothetical protein